VIDHRQRGQHDRHPAAQAGPGGEQGTGDQDQMCIAGHLR
jgi:hypothetical protein